MYKIKAILFDLDGVVYSDDKLIDGALETMKWINRESIKHLFVTNNTSRPYHAILDKLNNLGISATADQVWNPARAAKKWLVENKIKGSVALFVKKQTRHDFSEFAISTSEKENPEVIIIGDMVEEWSIDQMNLALRMLLKNPQAQLIALGMTRYYLASDGFRLDTGPMIKALEYATGKSAIVIGKPDRLYFQEAVRTLGVSPDECLMIGDDIQSDVGAAQSAGLKGILVKTGKFRNEDLLSDITPDAILDSIADLPNWSAEQNGKY